MQEYFSLVVGIVELLPEFDKITGIFGSISVSALYFVFLAGIFFGLSEFFYLFKNNEKESGITFSRIELFRDYAWIIKPLLYITILLIFITLYLVKIGCLQ